MSHWKNRERGLARDDRLPRGIRVARVRQALIRHRDPSLRGMSRAQRYLAIEDELLSVDPRKAL